MAFVARETDKEKLSPVVRKLAEPERPRLLLAGKDMVWICNNWAMFLNHMFGCQYRQTVNAFLR